MFKNMSIKAKLLTLALFTIIVVSVSVALESIYSLNKVSLGNIEKYKNESYSKKEEELKNYVSLAMKTVEAYHKRTEIDKIKIEVQDHLVEQTNFIFSILESEYKRFNGVLSDEALKFRLKALVKDARYGNSGYFWINDTDARIVMHPIKPQLNGKDLSNYKDKGGKKIFSEFANVAKSNSKGFVDYVWPKPNFEKPQAKVSFVKLFKPYNWVIGTGAYVSDVSSKIKKEALLTVSKMRYGKNGYFWINDSEHKVIMHSAKPSINGKSMYDLQDPTGKYLYREIVKTANANVSGGFVDYMWSKPQKEEAQPKISFVQRFEKWDWIIGTGAYVDDIESDIEIMKNNTAEEINGIIINISLFSLGAIVLVYLIYSFFVNRTIIRPITNLNDAVLKMAEDSSSNNNEIIAVSNDEIGKLVNSFNKYIKKLKDGYEEDSKVIEEVDDVISKVNNGFYVYKIEQNSSNPQISQLRDSINSMIDKTNENLVNLNNTLIEYGSSNFTPANTNTETQKVNGIISSITASTQLIGVTVSEFLSMITTSGKKLNDDTNVLSTSANSLSSSANEQAASLEETAAAVDEITSIIKTSGQKVHQMSTLATELQESSKEGESLASRTTKAMDDIDTQVNSINEAISVIDQIAFQTNILSLNAAVEAATAGEAGKGFAVVAQEVRNLASRSADAAKEIKDIVEAATSKANEGKAIADNMIGGYSTLNSKINETIGLIKDVSEASREQESGIIQINDAVTALDKATQQNANSASTISDLAQEVSSLSGNLLTIADRANFKESSKNEIDDIDLVFKISKLKNDHIKFKNNNFEKVGSTKVAWTVTKPTECDLGKWIIEQESLGKEFTKSSNWRDLKENHDVVHGSVQEYINENCDNANNDKLNEISSRLDSATSIVFKSLDQIKKENVVEKKIEQKRVTTPIIKEEIQRTTTNTSTSNNIITASSSDSDEWESF